MAVTQTSQIILKVLAKLSNGLDLTTVLDELNLDLSFNLGNGNGANQANMIWHDQRTLAASATEDLDLAGALTNAFGSTVTFTKIKAIVIRAASGNTNDVNVQRAAANGFVGFLAASDGLAVKPGGIFLLTAPDANGIAVTAATGDLLTITNSAAGSSVTYDVVIIGVV